MIDYAKIIVIAGSGGNGCGSFHKIKGKRYGKANGGDGGEGGNVYIEATGDLQNLEKYRFLKEYKALSGQHGLSRRRKGADGEDLILKVPVGTSVKISDAADTYDLANDKDRVLLVRGGQGGRGNRHLKDEFGRRPRTGEKGDVGEKHNLTLELKSIAQVGLIGLPNAGKSTLLSKLTAANPAIANYPFTTLEPNLGVIESHERMIIADIPGLIAGASSGKGLGYNFLRHIERTNVLVHLIDLSLSIQTGLDPERLWQDYQTIRNELKNYSKDLIKKKEIIALTKADLVSTNVIESVQKLFASHKKKVKVLSSLSGIGVKELVNELKKFIH